VELGKQAEIPNVRSRTDVTTMSYMHAPVEEVRAIVVPEENRQRSQLATHEKRQAVQPAVIHLMKW